MIEFHVNDQPVTFDGVEDTPLLWVLRDHLRLTGTKFGCGLAQCGACTVHLDGEAARTCVLPVSAVAGRSVVTIEGLSSAEGKAVQAAWEELSVPQCGYCQPGQIMAAEGLLRSNPDPSLDEVRTGMSGNLCRCGAHTRIVAAIETASRRMKGGVK